MPMQCFLQFSVLCCGSGIVASVNPVGGLFIRGSGGPKGLIFKCIVLNKICMVIFYIPCEFPCLRPQTPDCTGLSKVVAAI